MIGCEDHNAHVPIENGAAEARARHPAMSLLVWPLRPRSPNGVLNSNAGPGIAWIWAGVVWHVIATNSLPLLPYPHCVGHVALAHAAQSERGPPPPFADEGLDVDLHPLQPHPGTSARVDKLASAHKAPQSAPVFGRSLIEALACLAFACFGCTPFIPGVQVPAARTTPRPTRTCRSYSLAASKVRDSGSWDHCSSHLFCRPPLVEY